MLVETPLGVQLPDFLPHYPHEPQEAFLWLDVEEAFYGGAAGGGKSDALLMAALQYVHVPGYAAILLRKTHADLALPGAIMDRSKAWLSGVPGVRWNDNDKQWRWENGATLTFGYMQTSKDRYRYQGAEFQFVGFDELTQFEEIDYTYLLSRLRRPEVGPLATVPIRMRGAANPGGVGHRWVKRRFLDRLPFPDDPEDTVERCAGRVFVPAKLADNPSVDQVAYRSALSGLDPQTRAQLLEGDWEAREPGDWVFPAGLDKVFALGEQLDEQRKNDLIHPLDGQIIVAADWGVHAHVLILWPLEAGGFYVVKEIVNDVASIKTVAPRVADEILALRYPVFSERFDASMPGLNDAFMEKLRPLLPWTVKTTAVPFGKFKALTIDYLRLLVSNTATGELAPHLAISAKGCPVLAEQIHQWKYADPDVGRTEKGDDHGPDALVAGAAPVAAMRRKP